MDLSKKIPHYILSRKNITRLIFFTAGFALLFINIYSPFEIKKIIPGISPWKFFFYSSLIILTGVMVVAISRVIMYHHNKKQIKTSLGNYFVWVTIEASAMSVFYAFSEIIMVENAPSYWEAFKSSIQNTALVLLLPYGVSWLYFSYQDKKAKLQELSEGPENKIDGNLMIPFKDEKGTLRFSIKLEDLLYLKGADNYVTIFYKNKGKHSQFLLRNTLKRIENTFSDMPIIRCHRSYLVNLEKVKIIRRENETLILEMETDPQIEIPISKTYTESIFKAFSYN